MLDETVTAMGARALRRWILNPLVDAEEIWRRQEAVAELFEAPDLRARLRDALGRNDRLGAPGREGGRRARLTKGASRPRPIACRASGDPGSGRGRGERGFCGAWSPKRIYCRMFRNCSKRPSHRTHQPRSRTKGSSARGTPPSWTRFERPGTAPVTSSPGSRAGNASVPRFHRSRSASNKVFGYYLEVTRANLDKVPDDYVRKQTLANAERYFTPELKEWEEKVFDAEDRMDKLEAGLFNEVRARVAAEVSRIQEAGGRAARLDVLTTLAQVAERRGYVRPEVPHGV